MKERLLIVSNRLPVQISGEKAEEVLVPSSGGLVSSIKSFLQKDVSAAGSPSFRSTMWIGSLDISKKQFQQKKLHEQLFDPDFTLHPVLLPAVTRDKFYNGFCNDTIWPLFHYFPSFARFKDGYYEHYVAANKAFCEEIIAVYEPGDVIWIHDYHLMLLPALLRERIPDAAIGFFLHIPFPSFELFRMLPGAWRTALLHGLIGADLIGFHTSSYAQYFLRSVKHLLGYETSHRHIITEDRTVTVDTFPVGIDYDKFHKVMGQSEIFTERNAIRKRISDSKMIISVDRLDYTKGIINRLEGYELFLTNNPQYRRKVTLMMVVVPSRDIITKYKELKEQIEAMVGRINGKFGSIDWSPVIYQYKSVDFNQLCALYTAADVALVTPIRDGMNLIAKEFIATRSDKRGVLILSEGAGAASELGEALIVNPTDRHEIARAIMDALNMPVKDQMTRNSFMQVRLKNYDVVKWAEQFLGALHGSLKEQEEMKIKILHPALESRLQDDYTTAERRLLLFDYDGTLTPITKLPHLAGPNSDTLTLLSHLSADTRNTIVIISGRHKDVLHEWLGNIPVHLVAEHGGFIKSPSGQWECMLVSSLDWKSTVIREMSVFTDRCPGAFIEEKEISVAWHFRNAEHEIGFTRSRELFQRMMELSHHFDFQVMEGKKLIEVRPRGIDKGQAALRWIGPETWDFILALGDDRTDEDLFKVIPDSGWSIRIGLLQTAAKYNLSGQKDVMTLLHNLAKSSRFPVSNHQIQTS